MCASKNKKPKKRETKQKGETPNQKQRKHDHGPRENKGVTKRYVTSPCILHIPRYTCVGEETKYVVKEGAKGTTPHAKKEERRTNTHVIKHAHKHEPQPYIPIIPPYAPSTAGKKKAQKVWGGYGPWGNNGKATKYVKDTKEAPRVRTTRTQGRKKKENGGKVEEKHGMNPHPRPTHTTCTRSRYRR